MLLFGTIHPIAAQGPFSLRCTQKAVPIGGKEPLPRDVQLPIDPHRAVLVVIDFWENVAPFHSVENTANLVRLAQHQNIPVIFISHEFPLSSLVEVTDNDVELDGYTTVLENYFANNQMDIKTIFYAGYHTGECLTVTRVNSISRVSWRSTNYNLIAVRDCTWDGYWYYEWAMNGIESKFHSTTLADLADAFQSSSTSRLKISSYDSHAVQKTDVNFSSNHFEIYKKKFERFDPLLSDGRDNSTARKTSNPDIYSYNYSFGTGMNWEAHALVLINPSVDFQSGEMSSRAEENNRTKLQPLIDLAHAKGMTVCIFTNDKEVDRSLALTMYDRRFNNPDSLFSYLHSKDISRIIYAGNLSMATKHLAPLDAWQYTIFNTGFTVVFLEDCIITNETEESIQGEMFKKIFLERATFGRSMYTISTTEILATNQLRINEVYSASGKPNLSVELYNSSPFSLNLARLAVSFDNNSADRTISLPNVDLMPGSFFMVEFREHGHGSSTTTLIKPSALMPSTGDVVYVLNAESNAIVDRIDYPATDYVFGRFPDGGQEIATYRRFTPGKPNYFIQQSGALCDGGEVQLTTADGFQYDWQLNALPIENISSQMIVSEPGLYSVVVWHNGLSTSSVINVDKYSLPNANIEVNHSITFCIPPVLFVRAAEGAQHYWTQNGSVVATDTMYTIPSSGRYGLIVISKDGCENQSEEIVLTHPKDTPASCNFSAIAPNPNAGRFRIYIKDNQTLKSVWLYNLQGTLMNVVQNPEIVMSGSDDIISAYFPYSIDFSLNVPNGLYVLVLNHQGGQETQKLIVQR